MKLPINYASTHFSQRKLAREEYVRRQDGNCHYCKNPLSEEPEESVKAKSITPRLYPTHFFKWPVHLHHCRKTGMTIGAVHSHCNAVLWEYEGE